MKFRLSLRKWALLGCVLQLSWLAGCGGSEPPPAPAPPPSSTASSPPPPAAEPESSSDEVASEDGAGNEPVSPDEATAMGDMSGIMPSALNTQQNFQGMPTMGMSGGMSSGMGGGGMAGTESAFEGGAMNNAMGGPGMGMNGRAAIVDPAPDEDADYMTKAKYAFAIGKETVAEQYVIAHMLASDAEAGDILQQIRYCAGARRPSLVVRFAVGVELKAPSTLTDYKPIGHTQFAQRNGGGMGEMSMGSMGGQAGGQTAQKTLVDYTGRFGEDLIKSFESAWDSGSFGTVFKDVDTIVPVTRPTAGAGGGGMGGSGMGMSGMSMAMGPGAEMGMGQANNAAPADAALRGKATAGKQILPGLMFLGTGTKTELLGKAEAEGIDFVFFFDVDVENKRMGPANKTRLYLLSTHADKPIGATATLEALEVDKKMALKGDNDEVAKNLTALFKKVDTSAKLVDLPALKAANAQARIKSLIEKKTKDPLPTLMEIKLFHSLGLLNDEERDAAYQLTIGGNGLAFANGTAEDRDFVLSPMLSSYK